jgi:formate-dependent nitrite reductase membrane component NrfD
VSDGAPEGGRHGAAYSAAANFSPDAVANSMSRNDGGFGRKQMSYYDHPVVRKAHWRWEIEWYFAIGGVMSGSAALSALASTFGGDEDRALARSSRYIAFAGSIVSGALLVKDLGRPERFLNMLRIVKLYSPMSVGAWALSGFSALAGLALADQAYQDGLVPFDASFFVPKKPRDWLFALFGGVMASYTGVLICATAIPAWYHGRRFIPAIFVASATSAACAANIFVLALTGSGSHATLRKLERLESLAALAELGLLLAYEQIVGADADPVFKGRVGKKLKQRTELFGIALPLVLNAGAWKRGGHGGFFSRATALVSSALTLAGGLNLREAFLEAGRISGDDPRAVLRRPE